MSAVDIAPGLDVAGFAAAADTGFAAGAAEEGFAAGVLLRAAANISSMLILAAGFLASVLGAAAFFCGLPFFLWSLAWPTVCQ